MKCEHCGAHIEETDKRCPYCNSYNEQYKKPEPPKPQDQPEPPIVKNNVQPQPQIIKEIVYVKDEKANNHSEETERKKPIRKKKTHKSIVSLFMTAICLVAGIIIYNKVQNTAKSATTPTPVTVVTKAKPSVKGEQTLSGVTFTVQANDNYNEVQVVYEIYNSSNVMIKQGTLYGYNYIKGNSYTLSQNLSVSEQLSFDTIKYRIGYYK